jgi:sigma-E factor negative regulatory protein RseC
MRMAEMSGTVVSLDGGRALVRIAREGCGRCHEPGGCGGKNPARTFWVVNARGAQPGEEVKVVIPDRALLRGALAGYGFPLMTLFLGAGLGSALAGETGSMIGAACGLAVAWGGQRLRRVRNVLLGPDAEPRIE